MGRREIVAFSMQKPLPKERPEKEDFSEGREEQEPCLFHFNKA